MDLRYLQHTNMESFIQYVVRNLHPGLKMADSARDVDLGTNIEVRIDKIDHYIYNPDECCLGREIEEEAEPPKDLERYKLKVE